MTPSCPTGTSCVYTAVATFLAWWLISSALLHQTWNRVIGGLWKVKHAHYWQAVLLVATVCALAGPCWLMHSQKDQCSYQHRHCWGSSYQDADDDDCPYAGKKNSEKSEGQKPADSNSPQKTN